MFEVEIYITLKKNLADPQGITLKHALEALGYKNIEKVSMGKLIIINLNCNDRIEAEQQAHQMCKKLLANPIIEDYSFKIK
ncbi:MAG: phosphoribosylformylglycinamidine synthase subunit PurS [Candidatus Omnitrophica bacterium]|nr:phosphoribosylformylglycinamidine synthase subunit PurS [Candidatus Omnitrophota bacterium]MCM8830657.1 phosphoribosylformylglycinamidine synthase subunit PurS [Candidatus Omnitrophota bacterium]